MTKRGGGALFCFSGARVMEAMDENKEFVFLFKTMKKIKGAILTLYNHIPYRVSMF